MNEDIQQKVIVCGKCHKEIKPNKDGTYSKCPCLNDDMNEHEALMALLELAKENPELLFRICPSETRTNWMVDFTKGDLWWSVVPDCDDESLIDVIKEALVYFSSITDEMIQEQLKSIDKTECAI